MPSVGLFAREMISQFPFRRIRPQALPQSLKTWISKERVALEWLPAVDVDNDCEVAPGRWGEQGLSVICWEKVRSHKYTGFPLFSKIYTESSFDKAPRGTHVRALVVRMA